MKTKNLAYAFVLAVAATGCAAELPGDGDGDGGGGGGGDDAPRPMDASGRYQMSSTFDVATNAPGKFGEVSNAFIAMTDDADDPTNWILDQMIARTSGSVKSFLTGAKPFVAGYINDRLLQIAPDFVSTIVQVGNDYGQMAKGFGLNETLEVTGSPGSYSAKLSAIGVHFKVDSIEHDILFSDHAMAAVEAAGVAVTMDATGRLEIGEHKLPLTYGKIVKIGLDEMIIPAIDPTASNLNELLAGLVNCNAVGVALDDAMYDYFGFSVGPGPFTTACNGGLSAGANYVYGKIDSLDQSALEFGLTGLAKAIDTNKDGSVDTIQTGKWSGTLSYSGTPAPLVEATFHGSRM